jgi:hypothetical protein
MSGAPDPKSIWARHQPQTCRLDDCGKQVCRECYGPIPWPCDAARLAAVLLGPKVLAGLLKKRFGYAVGAAGRHGFDGFENPPEWWSAQAAAIIGDLVEAPPAV